ncbi:MAG: DUF1385 domain-containing protein [Oscillospiraceae bacterium]
MQKEVFKTKIGGQAVIEGIAMRGPEQTCLAVRLPDGSIHTELTATKKNPVGNIPILRGAVAMVISLAQGYKHLMKAADYAFPEEKKTEEGAAHITDAAAASETTRSNTKADSVSDETVGESDSAAEEKKTSWLGVAGGVLGGLLSIGLFVLLPTVLTGILSRFFQIDGYKSLIEGVLKIVIFVGYLFAVTRISDVRRVFEYHGAEHKTIACYEHRSELTVGNVRKYSRFHPRCGTSFLFIVLIISILIFSFVPWGSTLARVGLKILLLPLIMGISHEIIQYAGSHDNLLSRMLSAPGKWIQRLTAFEPSDDQIEIAIASLVAVLPDDENKAKW